MASTETHVKVSVKMPWLFMLRFRIMVVLIRAYVRVVKPTDEERELLEQVVGKTVKRLVQENVRVEHG